MTVLLPPSLPLQTFGHERVLFTVTIPPFRPPLKFRHYATLPSPRRTAPSLRRSGTIPVRVTKETGRGEKVSGRDARIYFKEGKIAAPNLERTPPRVTSVTDIVFLKGRPGG
ncbi:hypothetical protein Trydic_g10934 [Trypoxylus dichotomus]